VRAKLLIFVSLVGCLRAQQLTIGSPPPPPVSSITANTSGAIGTGTECYWLVARYPIGNILSGSSCVSGVGFAQGGSVNVNWSGVPAGTGYDVLRTATTTFPASGVCSNCLLASNAAGGPVNDTGAALAGYTLTSGVLPALATIYINNRDFSAPEIVFPNYLLNVQGLQFPDGTTQTTAGGGGGTGTVTQVTASSPLQSTGGTTPNISCPTCTSLSGASVANTLPLFLDTLGTLGNSNLAQDPAHGALTPLAGMFMFTSLVSENGGHPVFDCSVANYFVLTVTQPDTITLANCSSVNGAYPRFGYRIQENNTGGFAVTLPAGFSQAAAVDTTANIATTQWGMWDGVNFFPDAAAFSSQLGTWLSGPVRAAPGANPSSGTMDAWFDSTGLNFQTLNASGAKSGTAFAKTPVAGQPLLSFDPTTGNFTQGALASTNLSDASALVYNNAVNTGTAAMTLNLRASTVARIPAASSCCWMLFAYSVCRSVIGSTIACTGASHTGNAPA